MLATWVPESGVRYLAIRSSNFFYRKVALDTSKGDISDHDFGWQCQIPREAILDTGWKTIAAVVYIALIYTSNVKIRGNCVLSGTFESIVSIIGSRN